MRYRVEQGIQTLAHNAVMKDDRMDEPSANPEASGGPYALML